MANKEKFFIILFEILHNEVQIAIARSLFNKIYFERKEQIESRLLFNSKQFAEVVFRETGQIKNVEENLKAITSIDHMEAGWFLHEPRFDRL